MLKLKKEIKEVVESSFNEFIEENNLVKIILKKQREYPLSKAIELCEKVKKLKRKLADVLHEKLLSEKEINPNYIEFAQELIVEKIIQLKNDYHI